MRQRLEENIRVVKNRIEAAAERSNRDPNSVQLVAVTKYVDAATTRQLIDLGCHQIGESRPQILWDKAEELAELDVQWHMIGHLQRNKVKRTLKYASLIHSIDSLRLFKSINESAAEIGKTVHVLMEVNVSGEEAKHGFKPSEVASAWETIATLDNVQVDGLMCMAGLSGDNEQAKRDFASLRELADLQTPNLPANVRMQELSMGMSGDFEIAIEEGATIVRVGSILFEGILNR